MLISTTAPEFKSGNQNNLPVRHVLLPLQHETSIEFDEEGNARIVQSGGLEDDAIVFIGKANIDEFIDRLTDALGIPSFGRSK